jgi:hypothetical protein
MVRTANTLLLSLLLASMSLTSLLPLGVSAMDINTHPPVKIYDSVTPEELRKYAKNRKTPQLIKENSNDIASDVVPTGKESQSAKKVEASTPFVGQQMSKKRYPRADIDDIPIYVWKPKEWFTNTSDYDYFFEFIQGMELTNDFSSADLCIDNVIAFMDDLTQLENNYTLEYQYIQAKDVRFLYPVMNFTKMISETFAEAVPACTSFSLQFYTYWVTLYIAMGNNFNTMLISFLFTQLGNAIDFKSAIDRIEENEKNQDYQLVMFQYGRIVRLIFFEIQIITRGAIDSVLSFSQQLDQIDPVIAGFNTVDSTLEQVAKFAPVSDLTKLMNPRENGLTDGDVVATLISTVCAFGIYWLVD